MSDAVVSSEGPLLTLQEKDFLMPSDSTYPWWEPSPTAFSGLQEAQDPSKPLRETLVLEEDDKNALLVALDGYGESIDPSFALLPNVGYQHPVARAFEVAPAEKASPIDSDEALKLMVRRANATKRRNRHRQRVKEEWQSLRLQETLLSAELEGLRVKRPQGNDMETRIWKEMVSKELAARSQAEAQQRQILMEVERRAAVMHTLQEILYTQQFFNTSAPEGWGVDDIKLYENFQSELVAAYAQTDAIFHECGFNGKMEVVTSFYDPILRRDAAQNPTYFESASALTMPGKYPNTANAMFDAMRQVHRQNPQRSLYETDENLSNTIAVKFGTVHHCEEGRVVSMTMNVVQRRFVESERTVFVWRCIIEGQGEFAGTALDETGWSVLRPTSSDSTDVWTCVRSIPMHRNNQAAVTPADEFFAKAVVRSSQPDSLKLAQLMGELLIDSKQNDVCAVSY
ncbi:uncharacterized protein IUM83_19450 [Phytophthora cinnamomi]|uniref:uncharacterized protein n=1 Tax=Phytophthora cinnamomi TaxID=4785 RepID=UPI00355986D0|nr:hypothetical protein IUM83_19450 [Phytophthora cinnamomi]